MRKRVFVSGFKSHQHAAMEPRQVTGRSGILLAAYAVGLAGCGAKDGKDSALCNQAAARYTQCVAQTVGDEMAEHARRKQPEGLVACRKDQATQAMYQQCLTVKDCDAFLQCIIDYADETGTRPAPNGASRKEQCEHHVREGLRGVALQAVMLSERRDEASKREAQSCVLDESRELDGCLDGGERTSLAGYAEQRQRDCEAWTPELAACILKLEGAKDCDPDTYPFWREPIPEGAAGPAVAWSVTVAEAAGREPRFEVTADGMLAVADATNVRAIRGGKLVWRVDNTEGELWLAGGMVIVKGAEGGLIVLDRTTGQQRGVALPDTGLRAVGPAGSTALLALAEDGTLFRITPAACKGRGTSCAAKLATLPADDIPFEPILSAIGDHMILVATTERIQVYDLRGKPILTMALRQYGAEFVTAVPPDHVAVVDHGGAALLSVSACAKLGTALFLPSTVHLDPSMQTPRAPPEDCAHCKLAGEGCVTAYGVSITGDWQVPAPLPNSAIAFNDHGIVEKTHMVANTGGWSVKTGGQGQAAGDETHIYTVSFGQNSEGPVQVLSLARASGKVVWQSELKGAVPEVEERSDVGVVVAGPWLAARVGARIFALQLPR